MIKGSQPQEPVSVRYYTGPSESRPSASFLEECNGQEVIVFLVQVDSAPVTGYYFADYTPAAVIVFNRQELQAIGLEVAQQEEIVAQFKLGKLAICNTTAADAKVRHLLDGMTKEDTQKPSWEQLLKLSRQDIPAIVRAMDDQRLLAQRDVYLPNPPDSFETITQYGPPRIIEAASVLLIHLAKISAFRGINNGGSQRERLADMNGWRVWCHYNF